MPKYQPINLIGGFYTDDSLSWSAQDTVNWLPLAAEVEGTRTVTKLRSPPGLLLFSDIGPNPIRETHNVEGRLFTVSGPSLYEIAANGSETNRGAIPGVGRVSMAHNQITFGNQLTVVNGDSGYVWNTVTNTLTKISDPGFEGSIQVDFLNGFMIHLDPFGRFWFHSQPADALSFNTLDRYTSESSPDNMVGVKVFQSEVVVFNDSTIDFFGLTGSGELGGVFERKNIVINRGCASRDSIARVNNTLAWLGDDGSIYVLNGYREQKISTIPIEQAIAGLNWEQAFAEVWEDQGHTIYYLTFPDGRTWGYDFNSGLWTRRESYELNRWRMSSITFWQGKWIVGDFQSGKLYELKWNLFTENGRPLVSYRATGYSHSDQNRVLCPYLELMFDTGWAPNPNDLDPLLIQGDAPNQAVDTPYSFTYTATGGFGIYSFSTAGPLPDGLVLSTDGVLSGVPTVAGSFTFTVTVTDSLGQTASIPDTVEISFAANLLVGQTGSLVQYSGVTTQYNSFQSIVLSGQTPTDLSTTKTGEFCTWASMNSPFFRLFKRNSLGAYIEVPTPLNTMPAATLERAAISSDGTYIVTAQGTVWRLYKRNTGMDTYTLVNTIAGLNAATDLKFDATTTYLAGCASTGFAVYQIVADALVFVSAEFQGFNGIAWYGNRVASSRNVGNNGVWVWTLSGSVMTLVANAAFACPENSFINWTKDGTVLYMGGNTPTPRLRAYTWNGVAFAATAAQTATIPNSAISGLDITQDGRVMVVTSSDVGMTVRLYEVNGAVLTLLSPTSPVSDGTGRAAFVTSADFY